MNVNESTRNYEAWMQRCGPVIRHELRDKHAQMRHDPLQFLRGSYYRWARVWPRVCHDSFRAPSLLSVGDLHVDSFGTWRDAEGRMCWGVDDFDEAFPLPYTNDLTRIATSVKICKKLGLLSIRTKDACEAILRAYKRTLGEGGCPIVLAEEDSHLEKLGISVLKPPESFWKKLTAKPSLRGNLPRVVQRASEQTLPEPDLEYRVVRREAGLGSLGQLRFVAIAQCHGGCIAREAKNLVPSANLWLNGRGSHKQSYYAEAIGSALRSADPYQRVIGSWLVRRLSPDSNPIYIEELGKQRDEEILLSAMGREAANVHLGNRRRAASVLKDVRKRKANWLHRDAKAMARVVWREWKEFRAGE